MLKTIKIAESTHAILKWVQSYDKLRKEQHTDIDAIIYKALCWYVAKMHYPLEEALAILNKFDDEQNN